MLPKPYRLSLATQREKEITPVRKIYRGPFFKLAVEKREPEDKASLVSQFAFVVSNRVSKRAVIRNRIKRLLREIVRYNLAQIENAHRVTIFARQSLVGKNFREIKLETEKVFREAGLLKTLKNDRK